MAGGFDGVVATGAVQAAADEGDVGVGVEMRQGAHDIADQHLRALRPLRSEAAGEAALANQLLHLRCPSRMPWHEDQAHGRVLGKEHPMGVENDLLLAGMGAAGDPRWGAVEAGIGDAEWIRRQLRIELDAARHLHLPGAQGTKPRRGIVVLAQHAADVLQRLAEQWRHAPIAAVGTLRQPRVDEEDRSAAAGGAPYQVRPQLGLHQHQTGRRGALQKTPNRPRIVVRGIAVGDVAQQGTHPLAAGRRHGGYENGTFRQTFLHGLDDRRRGVRLAGRNRVKPHGACRQRRRVAEPLADALAVAALGTRPPVQPGPNPRQRQMQQQAVEVSHGQGGTYTCVARLH